MNRHKGKRGRVKAGKRGRRRQYYLRPLKNNLSVPFNSLDGIQPVLGAETGNPDLLSKIKDSAKDVAASEKYKSCGEDARKIVELTSGHASRWYSQMRRIQTN